MRPLKSVEEAAHLLGISPWTVRSYIHTGKLKPVRIGRRVLLSEEELERLISRGEEQPHAEPTRNENVTGEVTLSTIVQNALAVEAEKRVLPLPVARHQNIACKRNRIMTFSVAVLIHFPGNKMARYEIVFL